MAKYKIIDLESKQCIKEGTIADLSRMMGITESTFRYYVNAKTAYKKRYQFERLEEEKKELKNTGLLKQWEELHQISLDVKEGRRRIQRAADGKRYAVKI